MRYHIICTDGDGVVLEDHDSVEDCLDDAVDAVREKLDHGVVVDVHGTHHCDNDRCLREPEEAE